MDENRTVQHRGWKIVGGLVENEQGLFDIEWLCYGSDDRFFVLVKNVTKATRPEMVDILHLHSAEELVACLLDIRESRRPVEVFAK